jgi:hypothetical protein
VLGHTELRLAKLRHCLALTSEGLGRLPGILSQLERSQLQWKVSFLPASLCVLQLMRAARLVARGVGFFGVAVACPPCDDADR